MQGLILCILVLDIVSPILCLRNNGETKMNRYYRKGYGARFDVMDYGAVGDGESDDSKAFLSAWQHACGAEEGGTLVIPPQKIFLVTTLYLQGPCEGNTSIELAGKIVAPTKSAWVGDNEKWIRISKVNGLTINGTGGIIDGSGSTWWECKICRRPRVLSFYYCIGLSVMGLSMVDSPGAHISVNACEDVSFSEMHITAPADSPNTDGFDISSSKNVLIHDSYIGTGDDCVAINNGSSYINITGVACGPGHGISVGSLGKDHSSCAVEEVYVKNCSFNGTQNGARIKTWEGGSGYARRITFEQITLENVKNPIIINQSYSDLTNVTTIVAVKDVMYREFQGTSSIPRVIAFDCAPPGCYDIVLDHVMIDYQVQGKKAYAYCKNAYGKATYTVPNVTCLMNK